MKKYIPILLAFFSFGAPGVAQTKSTCQPSKEYLSPDGRFSVCFPGVPKESDLPYDIKVDSTVSHAVEYDSDVTHYSVTYIDYPAESVPPDAVKQLLDNARDGGLARIAKADPRIIAESDITVQGYPGKHLQIELKGDAVLRQRILVAGNRMYVFGVGTPKGAVQASNSPNTYEKIANSFFDSFKIFPPLTADLSATWKEFSSTEGKFKISFPGIPYQSNAMGSGPGGTQMHTAAYESAIYYIVSYVDDPKMPADPAGLKTYLDEQRDAQIKWFEQQGLKFTNLKETDITVGGYPGRFVEAEVSSGHIYRRKIVVVKNRFFTIDASTPKPDPGASGGDPYEKLSLKFMNSFSLIGP
jgi:hypothetical protein